MRSLVIAAALGSALMLSDAAYAAEPGTYANWSVSGSSGNWTGGGTPAAGFPVATLSSNATSVAVPTGASAFLGPGTPIGAAYGSSQQMNYLNVSSAAGLADSTTTWTFASPTPAGKWAFAVGDVDADKVQISATDAGGAPVPVAQLGFQSTFNYCNSSPKPGSCLGPGPFTDVPTWNPATATLTGNFLDTNGASAWFEPTAAIKTLTFKFSVQIGIPVFQLWLATKSVPVVVPIGGSTPSSPVTIELDTPAGTPIVDPQGNPVQAVTDATGTATIPAVVDGSYLIHVIVPPGTQNAGATDYPITVNTDNGPVIVPPGVFTVVPPTLPATGRQVGTYLQVGGALLGTGLALVCIGSLRRRNSI
jgi:hypothetical protein